MITVEAIAFELKCHDKIMRPICHEPHCRLASKDMNCVKGSIPTQIDLKQVNKNVCLHFLEFVYIIYCRLYAINVSMGEVKSGQFWWTRTFAGTKLRRSA